MHIIHIGLPKTATTTLQSHVFPRLRQRAYVGVHQPRGRTNQPLYHRILEAVEEQDRERVEHLVSQLKQEINECSQPFLISEEMFLVDSKIRWQEKLARLGIIFSRVDVRVLVSLRKPLDGAHSLYVELYHHLHRENPSFKDFWEGSNQSQIFRYKKLLETVGECLPDASIRLLTYEGLVHDQDTFLRDLGASLEEVMEISKLHQTNQRRKSLGGSWTTPYCLRSVVLKRLAEADRFSLGGVARFVASRCIRGPLNPKLNWTSKFIEKPGDEWREELQKECEWLFDAYAIDYRQ